MSDHGDRFRVLQELADEEARLLWEIDPEPPGANVNGQRVGGEDGLLDESWQWVDLGPALRGEITRPAPTVLRTDGDAALLYSARVNGIHGDSGDGKSFVAYLAAAQELESGNTVVWVDFEDNEAVVVERLRDTLFVAESAIEERFVYTHPSASFDVFAVLHVTEKIAQEAPSLVVIDSLGEAFALEGLDEDRDVMVAPWYRRVPRALAEAGPAVLLIDHSTKAKDNPLFPSGSKRKRAAITGASYLLEARESLTREHGGKLVLTCAKDRHGNYKKGDVVATFEMNVYPDGGAVTKLVGASPFEAGRDDPDERIRIVARAAIRACKTAGRPLTKTELVEKVKGRRTLKLAGIDHAIGEGSIRVDHGENRSKLHAYVKDLPELQNDAE